MDFVKPYLKVLNTPKEIHIGPYIFTDVEVAETSAALKRGLMNRTDVPDDFCMLFKFDDDAVRSFWMMNCLFPINVIFLDKNLKIVSMHEMKVEPKRGVGLKHYSSGVPARYAIEFKDSAYDDSLANIKVGSTVKIVY